VTAPDDRAVRILMDAYWSSEGWRPGPEVSPEDRDHAVQAGVMARDTSSASHDDVISGVLDSLAGVSAEDAASCFLASLTTRRLDLRSALSSFVLARRLEPHAFVKGPSHISRACAVCGLFEADDEVDWNVLNFERFKWGGVRRDDLTYVWLDLRQFAAADRPRPTAADRSAFERLLDGLEAAAPATTAPKAAAQRWSGIPSNKAEREVLLDILGICSVLESPDYPGFLQHFVPASDRVVPQHKYAERPYPVCWWRAEFGVNRPAARTLGLL
jgi:hypothetical protein